MQYTVLPLLFKLTFKKSLLVLSYIVAVQLNVLVIDLEFANTLSRHNRDALLNGTQHKYAWRVHGKGTKLYWYPNTAQYHALQ